MSLAYYDGKKFLSRAPSYKQWQRLRRQLTGESGSLLAATGATGNPHALDRELDGATDRHAQRLQAVARRASAELRITDGADE